MSETIVSDPDHPIGTLFITPDSCKFCGDHLAREWNYCPECGRPTRSDHDLSVVLRGLKSLQNAAVQDYSGDELKAIRWAIKEAEKEIGK